MSMPNQPLQNPANNAAPLYAGPILLFAVSAADFTLTTDQALSRLFSGTSYAVTGVIARRRSGAASVVCAGGVYDAVSKGGNAIVSAAQSWVTLASGIMVSATLAALTGTNVLSGTPFLSLTTGSTGACTADLLVFGYDLT